ncbi:MAG TPA: sialidase family protein [Mycobacteriales bacterium]|nr:sialidase family protein [Mycobacteriales bacterium]
MLRLRNAATALFLVVLAAGAAAVVGIAVHHTRGHVSADQTAAISEHHVVAAAEPGTPTPASSPAPAIVRGRLLSVSGPGLAWRAAAGCAGSARLQASTDGGRSWQPLSSPAKHILRLGVTGADSGWVVGADARCTPTYYTTTDGGATWSTGSLHGIWVPTDHGIVSPAGSTSHPCGRGVAAAAEVLAPSGTEGAFVICSQSTFWTTSAGHTWQPGGQLPAGQPVAAALTPAGHGVLLLSDANSCRGLQVERTSTTGRSWQRGQCVRGLADPAAVSLTSAGYGLIAAGAAGVETNDGGRTWH